MAARQKTKKVYVMTDLEGPSGVNGRCADTGIGNKIINEETACRLLTEEVNAVVEGLSNAGAKEIIVIDGHGGSNSIHIENLHPKAELKIYGGGVTPITCVDASYDAALHIGAHSMIGVKDGFMNHTFNSHSCSNMWLNDMPVGEIAIFALLCSYFGVPTILVSGDRAACREAKEFLGKVETVETKIGLSRYSVINKNPVKVREELRQTAKQALENRNSFPIKNIKHPYRLKIELMCPNQADAYEKKGAKRLDHQTVLIESKDFMDLWAQRVGWAPGIHNARFNIHL
ncbi:MAG: M55 family metallopeptidase [bacterium]|nr:M55 family metallopeptidase [bacterium]